MEIFVAAVPSIAPQEIMPGYEQPRENFFCGRHGDLSEALLVYTVSRIQLARRDWATRCIIISILSFSWNKYLHAWLMPVLCDLVSISGACYVFCPKYG
jgi:hypothetical protein